MSQKCGRLESSTADGGLFASPSPQMQRWPDHQGKWFFVSSGGSSPGQGLKVAGQGVKVAGQGLKVAAEHPGLKWHRPAGAPGPGARATSWTWRLSGTWGARARGLSGTTRVVRDGEDGTAVAQPHHRGITDTGVSVQRNQTSRPCRHGARRAQTV